jgi:hypothetical protein
MDLEDYETRKVMAVVTEADKNGVLLSLTNRLYDQIMNKYDDVDMGEIPRSKGDVDRIAQIKNLMECHVTIKDILLRYKQPTDSIDTIIDALNNLRKDKPVFVKAYRMGIEMLESIYETVTLAVVASTSLLISSCIEYVRIPNEDGFQVAVDRAALAKSKENLLFTNLKKYNEYSTNGTINNIADMLMNKRGQKALVGETIAISAVGVAVLVLAVIPMMRELIYFFFRARTFVSDYFAVQSELLNINAYNLQYNDSISPQAREKIKGKQLGLANKFRHVSNAFEVKMKEAEKATDKEIAQDNRKFKVEELSDKMPDSAGDALF